MKLSMNSKLFFSLIWCSVISFQVFSQEKPFQKTPTGLKYLIHKSVPNAQKPATGDVVELNMVYRTADSILFDSRKGGQAFTHVLENPIFKGDFNEALGLLGIGDSATFLIKADSFYLKTLHETKLPKFIKKGSDITFNVKLLSVTSNAAYMRKQMEYLDELQSKATSSRNKEKELIKNYFVNNNLKPEEAPSGIYYITERVGNGISPVAGSTVVIDYRAYVMNGKEFESTIDLGIPLEFKLGGHTVIKGLEEAVLLMKKGGKATFIIPSNLAYNENEVGEIAPFSTLIYELELLDVK